jgi:Protein of unknown function (DUF998)
MTMVRRTLLLCGALSSLLYLGIDLLGALSWEGYSYSSQTISEMTAVDAPTRNLLTPFYVGYTLLLIAFGAGVRSSPGQEKSRRVAGSLLAAVGLVGLIQPFFPMHLRGAGTGFTDTGHIVLGGVNVLFLLLAIGFGAREFGGRFRLYSAATIAAMVVFGAWTGFLAPGIPAGLPTPYIGVVERAVFASFLLWIAVYACALLRSRAERPGKTSVSMFAA